jgi:hypothetical protein
MGEAEDTRLGRSVAVKFLPEAVSKDIKISPQSVMRDWRPAKAFLMSELSSPSGQS